MKKRPIPKKKPIKRADGPERVSGSNGRRHDPKNIYSILRVVLIVLAGFVMGLSLYLITASRLAGNSLPQPFGYGVSLILSGSMEPALSENDLVVVHRQDSYSVGDIIVYQADGILIAHRILSIDPDTEMVVTQGDANNISDDPIPLFAIKGKVIASSHFGGNLIRSLRSPVCFVAILILSIIGLEYSFSRKRKADDKDLEALKEEIRKLKETQDEKH